MKIVKHVLAMKSMIPPLYGLVLLGGKSVRMGQDKAQLKYHNQPQFQHVANLLNKLVAKTYISGRGDQRESYANEFPFLADAYKEVGPIGGILTAFKKHPDKAWLVMAIDLPNMDDKGILELIKERDTDKDATAFWNKEMDAPEPLMTIWEPSMHTLLLDAFAKKELSVKKILAQASLKMVQTSHPEKLLNANRPEDLQIK